MIQILVQLFEYRWVRESIMIVDGELRLIQEMPARVKDYPQLRFMGSKFRLLDWIYEVLSTLEFETALDPFAGSGCVAYLIKAMGKQVTSSDFLNFSAVVARALVENSETNLTSGDVDFLVSAHDDYSTFIRDTFKGIFYTVDDLDFLDMAWHNIQLLEDEYKRALAIAALIRSSVKRQPRGVFTVAGDPERYKDGRRDLSLSLKEHFIEQIDEYNHAVFDNGRCNHAFVRDVFNYEPEELADFDLVYLDPPYIPRSDDNCYIKRYHFLEGLSCYWQGLNIMEDSKVKKIPKRYTPFSYRSKADSAFNRLFSQFSRSILVLSYSSNGYPDLDHLVEIMKRHKRSVEVFKRRHRYHFGTHSSAKRNKVREYLIVGE